MVIGMKLAVTGKCWNRKTEVIFFKGFHQSGAYPAPEEEMRAGFRKVVQVNDVHINNKSFETSDTGL